jgi:hypothetical protein
MTVTVVEVMLPNQAVALVRAVDLDGQAAEKVAFRETYDLAAVSKTLEGIAQAIRSGLEKATPSKTTVEFGIDVGLKDGKLTGLVVEGEANASLKVTLEWGPDQSTDGRPAA